MDQITDIDHGETSPASQMIQSEHPIDITADSVGEKSHEANPKHRYQPAGLLDVLFGILRLILFIVDIGSDIYMAVVYFKNGDVMWGSWTISFVIVAQLIFSLPALVSSVTNEKCDIETVLMTMPFIFPLVRYVSITVKIYHIFLHICVSKCFIP